MVREGRTAHVVVDRRTIEHRKPGRAIGQQTRTLSAADLLTQVGLWVQTIFAFATFRRVKRDDVIADLKRSDAFADLDHDASTFVA